MRAMYPKSPAKCRWGIRRANILPPRGIFVVRSPQIMHGAQILPSSDELGPCAGMPTPQRLANTCHPPYLPALRQCLPLRCSQRLPLCFCTSFRSVASLRQRPGGHPTFPPDALCPFACFFVILMAPAGAEGVLRATSAQLFRYACVRIGIHLVKRKHYLYNGSGIPGGHVPYRTINKEKRLRWQLLHIALSARKRRKW